MENAPNPLPGVSAGAGPTTGVMPDDKTGLQMLRDRTAAVATAAAAKVKAFGSAMLGNTRQVAMVSDQQYLDFFNRCFREATADRWIFERQWTRVLHYCNLRQWLAPYSRTEGWRDARIAKGVPRPCTSKPKEVDQAIRAMFASIRFGVIVRPSSPTIDAITTAATADDLAPLLHDVHDMDTVMTESDFWLVNLGNTVLHSYWDEDRVYGFVDIPYEVCTTCQKEWRADQIAAKGQTCPTPGCAGRFFIAATNTDGSPKTEPRAKGAPATKAYSLLECLFPLQRPSWARVPYVITQAWRTRSEFEESTVLQPYVNRITWSKGPGERSLQIFQSLALMNDIPTARNGSYGTSGSVSSSAEDGVAEFTLWHRPTNEHPDGLVIRVFQENDRILFHDEANQGLPGKLPYKDGKGNPLFTFSHAGYQQVGGRVIASGVHDSVMQKYDAVNRVDSLIEMIAMRMAAPQWMLPKGAETAWLGNSPGVPGLILTWNASVAGAAGRPERVPGIAPDPALVAYRQRLLEDIDEGTGTYDILRGARPTGVEAFSAMQLLVEAGQRRFSSAFQARGNLYKDWYGFALELERQFGPDDRTLAVMLPSKSWAFQTFKKADLRGDVSIVIEDGTYTPKTSLGERAAIEHLRQLGLLDANDPDQKYTIFQKFGLVSLLPALDCQVQAALKNQEEFEQWVAAKGYANVPQGVDITKMPGYPFKWRRWYEASIHRSEFLKWANSDRVQRMLIETPQLEGLLDAYLMLIDVAILEAATGQPDPDPAALIAGEPGGQPPAQPGAPGATAPPAAAAPPAGMPVAAAGARRPTPPGRAPMRRVVAPRRGGAGRAMANSNTNAGGLSVMPGMPGAGAPPA